MNMAIATVMMIIMMVMVMVTGDRKTMIVITSLMIAAYCSHHDGDGDDLGDGGDTSKPVLAAALSTGWLARLTRHQTKYVHDALVPSSHMS